MKKKIQIVLSILLLTLIFVFYIIFFKSEKKISVQQPDETTTQKKDGSNIIENLKYPMTCSFVNWLAIASKVSISFW